MEKATFSSWKNLHPMPKEHKSLAMRTRWSNRDFELLSLGWIPRNRHDKWFVLFDERFYIFRARSGYCVFEVLVTHAEEGCEIQEVRLNNDPNQCLFQEDASALKMLHSILNTTLRLRRALPNPEQE